MGNREIVIFREKRKEMIKNNFDITGPPPPGWQRPERGLHDQVRFRWEDPREAGDDTVGQGVPVHRQQGDHCNEKHRQDGRAEQRQRAQNRRLRNR